MSEAVGRYAMVDVNDTNTPLFSDVVTFIARWPTESHCFFRRSFIPWIEHLCGCVAEGYETHGTRCLSQAPVRDSDNTKEKEQQQLQRIMWVQMKLLSLEEGRWRSRNRGIRWTDREIRKVPTGEEHDLKMNGYHGRWNLGRNKESTKTQSWIVGVRETRSESKTNTGTRRMEDGDTKPTPNISSKNGNHNMTSKTAEVLV